MNQEQVELAAARAKLAELSVEEQASKTGWKPALDERIRLLEELKSTASLLTGLPDAEQLQAEEARLEAELEELSTTEPATQTALESIDDLARFERASEIARAAEATAQSAFDEGENAQKLAREELLDLPNREAGARQRRSTLTDEDELTRYRLQSAQLDSRVTAARAEYLAKAKEAWESQEPVLLAELGIAQRRAQLSAAELALAREAAATLRVEQERVAREAAAEEARRAELENDPVQRLRLRLRSEKATLVADDASQRTEIETLKVWIAEQKALLAKQSKDRESLEERLLLRPQGAEEHLLRTRKRCEQSERALTKSDLPAAVEASEQVQVRLVEVLDRSWELRLPENATLAIFLEEMGEARAVEARKLFPEILKEEGVLEVLADRQEGLEETDASFAELTKLMYTRAASLEELEQFIIGRMMWSQSDSAITMKTFRGAWEELTGIPGVIFDPEKGPQETNSSPGLELFLVVFLVLLVLLTGWLRRLRNRDRERADLGPSRNMFQWLRVLALAALPSAILWTLIGAFEADDLRAFETRPLAVFVHWQASLILVRRLTRALLGPKGLTIGKWGVLPAVGLQFYRSVRLATLAMQVLYAPWLVLSSEPFHAVDVPRLIWVVYVGVMSIAVLLLFRGKGAIVQNWTAPSSLSRLAVQLFGALGLLMLVPTVVLEILGYRVGAAQYVTNGMRGAEALFLLMGIYRVLERLGDLVVRVLLRRMPKDVEEQERTRTRDAAKALTQLASTILIVVAALLLQRAWGLGAPTQRLLASFEILQLDQVTWLTGWDVMLGIFWIAGGHLVAHNLSSLHDRVLVPFIGSGEVGGRYAALTLIRYAILCLAYLAGLRTVGLDMETLGWLMTGASVGLGFGMQEVVANFISGLILLFEQPIRVGDLITVGSTGGKVENITIRATVVTNWDRQAVIIPNKTFITQTLINWTRNDSIMRRTLPVRVAYGTDLEKALQLVDGILSAHPAILEDPPHRIWVQKFGDFGVELDVWFFTTINDGLTTRSEVHAAILNRFQAEGVEIPVVMRDVQAAE